MLNSIVLELVGIKTPAKSWLLSLCWPIDPTTSKSGCTTIQQFRDAVLGDMASRHPRPLDPGHQGRVGGGLQEPPSTVSLLQVTVPAGAAIPPQALQESATSKLCRRRRSCTVNSTFKESNK
uniref:(northern house mosquito) hypothetical protein n=1 Tax=Culex pipiens TaxID=7175 RepID=A0A8D8CBJ6_CULPI